jgi:D-xylose transport system permease protein
MLLGVLDHHCIGALSGAIIIKFRLPSFIVTLAGLLGWEGVLIYLVDGHGVGGTISVTNKPFYDLVNANLSPLVGWIFVVVVVVFFGGIHRVCKTGVGETMASRRRRRS